MTKEETAAFWQKRARDELAVAQSLLAKAENEFYAQSLFHCHLALELAMKGKFVQEYGKQAPYTHDLSELAVLLQDSWTQEQLDALDDLTEFSILSRYGGEEWFQAEATKQNASDWIEKGAKFLSLILGNE